MIKPPEHPLNPAFEKARDWIANQEQRLTDRQRPVYENFVASQALERQQEHDRLDTARAQVEIEARKRKLKTELVLKPPATLRSTEIDRQMQNLRLAEKRLEQLDRKQSEQRVEALKAFEAEREEEKTIAANGLGNSWAAALQQTARQEKDRSEERDRDFGDEFGR